MLYSNNLKVSTTDSIPGSEIVEYCGIVFKKDVSFIENLGNMFKMNNSKVAGVLDSRYNDLLSAMIDNAKGLHANAIVGLKIDVDFIDNMLMISGIGTAVTVREISEEERSSDRVTWQCTSCKTTNKIHSKFCVQCGQKRGEPWKCTSCKTSNASEHLFCSNCGMSRNASADLAEQRKEEFRHGKIDYEALLNEAEQCAKALEIEQLIRNTFEGSDSEDVSNLLKTLQIHTRNEKMYGNMKRDAITLVRKFVEKQE